MIIDELFEGPQLCPECGGISFSDLILAEKKDACYYKVKSSAKVWPSAYASGRLVQCRKKGAANYGNKSEGVAEGSRTPQDWEVKSAVWGLDKRGVHQEPQDVKSHFVRADRSSRAEKKAKREYEPGRQTWEIHPRGNKQQGVAEGSDQQWVVTVGTKTGGTSHTMTFSGTKEQAIKQAVARFGTSKNPVVTAKPKQQGVAEGADTSWIPDVVKLLGKLVASSKAQAKYNVEPEDIPDVKEFINLLSAGNLDAARDQWSEMEWNDLDNALEYFVRKNGLPHVWLHKLLGQQGVAEGASDMFSKVMGHETSPEAAKQIQQQGFKNTHTGIFFNIGDQNYSGGGYGGTVIMAKVSGPADGILDLDDDDNLPDDLDEFADGEEIADYARNKGYWAWTDGVQFAVLDPRHIQVVQQGVAEGSEPQVGDAVYYGKRLVGWFKGYSEHGKIITEPNYEEMGDEYANRDVYWDPQDKITIKPEQGVAEEQELDEKWSQKYKSSINCANPKGFSQKAHCAGRNKNEDVAEGALDDSNFGKSAALMTPSPQAAQQAKDIVQKQADANVISQAKIAGAAPVTREGEQQKGADYRDPKEVNYDDEYDAMVARVKKLAGLGPMKTVYDPTKRQYRNMPTAVQPKK